MAVIVFILGACLGSFFLVVGKRLPNNENIIFSRSRCDSCHHILAWHDLVPIFSYILLKGKCKYCQSKISPINLIVEVSMGLMFLLGYLYFTPSYMLYGYLILASLMMIIFITDFSYYIILDSPLIISVILFAIAKFIYFGVKEVMLSLVSGIMLFAVMYLIKLIGDKIFKRESLGGGDIKLSFVIGFVLGFRLSLLSLILSSFLALPYSVASLKLQKNNEVPFGPFLVSSLFIVFLFQDKFINIINLF